MKAKLLNQFKLPVKQENNNNQAFWSNNNKKSQRIENNQQSLHHLILNLLDYSKTLVIRRNNLIKLIQAESHQEHNEIKVLVYLLIQVLKWVCIVRLIILNRISIL